ncbi:MAG: hypothetical protein M3277_12315 [Actinomycetota bacterium]|nr:hypothetical protein [Actinomycetota bacterium]
MPESYDRLRRASFRRGQKRRQQILLALCGAAAISFFAALVGGGAAWEAHLALDASLGLYVMLLLDAKRRRAERGTKVHALRRRQVPAREEVAFYEPVKVTAENHG